jgi:drug/metabolite transporter (DMT)-like permease
LGASIIWGLQYAVSEQILKVIPTVAFTVIYGIGLATAYLLYFLHNRDHFQLDSFQALSDPKTALHFLLVIVLGCLGTLLIFSAIHGGNAVKASIVEITYPFFIAVFTTWVYKEHSMNVQTYIGAAVTFAGMAIIMRA